LFNFVPAEKIPQWGGALNEKSQKNDKISQCRGLKSQAQENP
jgi:hypothetical protein